ncbi:MAG TPA: AI-2E family transporter [Candidatus Binatia bacterium]|nr:AI-2E family transporter [Candidatus Binatia bacterium]
MLVFAASALIVAALYLAQAFLIPIALAFLLTFLLAPVVAGVERFKLGRVAAVLLVVVLVFSLMGAGIWMVATQLTTVANQLPTYRNNIRQKIIDIRGAGKNGALEKVKKTAQEVQDELGKDTRSKPREVVIKDQDSDIFWPLSSAVAPLLDYLAAAGLVVVLVVFMLIRRENLRDRLIRLLGYGRLTITTKAIEEAGRRMSRYLLTQALLNTTFGLSVAVALFFIGLPYAILWGFLAAVLRFIPYVGPTVAATLPTILSLAVFNGWFWPLLVVGVILALELVNNKALEPLLYGESAGVSEVGLLVAIAFWTWLWGPVGLILATPLTVCVVVMSKYVPQLEFISVLMSDDRVVETDAVFYQRLLAMDRVEAKAIVENYLKAHPIEQIYDELMIPALSYAKRDVLRGTLTDTEEQLVFQTIRELLGELGAIKADANRSAEDERKTTQSTLPSSPAAKLTVLGCPARDEADEIALLMVKQLLDSTEVDIEVLGDEALTAEILARIAEKKPPMLCVASIAPDGLRRIRALCKRVRMRFPEIKISIARLGSSDPANSDSLMSAGADKISNSLTQWRDQVVQISYVTP